jgi:hypothetical protein
VSDDHGRVPMIRPCFESVPDFDSAGQRSSLTACTIIKMAVEVVCSHPHCDHTSRQNKKFCFIEADHPGLSLLLPYSSNSAEDG